MNFINNEKPTSKKSQKKSVKKKNDDIKKENAKSIPEKIKEVEVANTKIENTPSRNNKLYFGFTARLILHIFFLIISLCIFILCFVNGIKFKVNYNLDYKIKSDVNYQVYLKDNDYYKEKSLKEDMQYITDLIDYIDINFNYKIDTNKQSNYDYKYNITADIIVTDRNDNNKVLYKDSDVLKDTVNINEYKDNNIDILENLKIDYSKYNNLVNSFKSKYVLSASSNLVLTMHVDAIVRNSNVDDDIVDSEDLKVTIPLSEQTINILKDYDDTLNTGTISKYSYIKIENKYYAIISVLSLILSIISLAMLLKFVKKLSKRSNKYNKKLKRIMKEYDRIIVTLSKMPDLNNYHIIEVESFEELLDAKQNLDKPILHVEIHKNQKSWFLILTDTQAYRYILKEVDLKNEKNN